MGNLEFFFVANFACHVSATCKFYGSGNCVSGGNADPSLIIVAQMAML